MKIAFIGGGNMATALISGILKQATSGHQVRVSEPNPDARERLSALHGVECHESASPAVDGTEVIVLATKPQVMPQVLAELSGLVQHDQLVISIAAGITTATIHQALAGNPSVIRTMPNTPALIGKGICGMYAAQGTSDSQRRMAEEIMSATGHWVWLEDESLVDVVTAISGSGPAYFFLLIEALRDAGEALGLSREVAASLALHTAYGAGAMAVSSEVDVSELRRRVTSPGGTTEAALDRFEAGGFSALVHDAASAAAQRGRELARQGS